MKNTINILNFFSRYDPFDLSWTIGSFRQVKLCRFRIKVQWMSAQPMGGAPLTLHRR